MNCIILTSNNVFLFMQAAEEFKYAVSVDVRELISVSDVADEFQLGPNGALVYCMEFLLDNIEWLEDKLDAYIDNDYLVFDLPGQIELYTHFPFMRQLVGYLQKWDFRVQALYFLDSQFMADGTKFFGGCVTALSAMVQLEVPHINVISKMDLARGIDKRRLEEYMYADIDGLVHDLSKHTAPKFLRLNHAMGNLLEQFSMVSFVSLDVSDNDSIADLLMMADLALQYDDEVDVRDNLPDEPEDAGDE